MLDTSLRSPLVSTDWVAEHLYDPGVRLVESDEDPLLYAAGHLPGAVEIDWVRDLNDPVRRDYLSPEEFARLASRCGIERDTLVVFYGDRSNWWAAYAFWVFSLFGHPRLALMDGGRLKWEKEGRPLVRDVPNLVPTVYPVPDRDDRTDRIFRDEVLAHVRKKGALVDVRSEAEYRGELVHMPDYPNEGALRAGHIPGAKSVPWARAVDPDTGTFRPVEELRKIYLEEAGLSPEQEVVVYCRIGERSSHTWFALKHLLGFRNVRNYDGSWTEWGNLVGAPIAKGDAP